MLRVAPLATKCPVLDREGAENYPNTIQFYALITLTETYNRIGPAISRIFSFKLKPLIDLQ